MYYEIKEDDYDSCVINDEFISMDNVMEVLEDYTLGEIVEMIQCYDNTFIPKLLKNKK